MVLWRWLRDAVNGWIADRAMTLGAALAFYALSSVVPMLVLTIAVAGIVFGPDAARGAVIEQLTTFLGEEGARQIETALNAVGRAGDGVLAVAIAIGTLMLSATGMLSELRDSLNVIFRAPPPERPGWLVWIIGRLLSIALIASFGALLLASLALGAVLTALGDLLQTYLPLAEVALQVLNQLASFVVTAAFFALVFAILPSRRLPPGPVLFGAGTAALLFTVAKFGVGLYLGIADYRSTWGAAGAIAAMLFWIWVSSLIFLFGAELARAAAGLPMPPPRRQAAS
jgi:membrane protein